MTSSEHKAHERDIDKLVRWRRRIADYEDTSRAPGPCSLAETISICLPLYGRLEMAVTRHREADDRYQRVRQKGSYRPAKSQPIAIGLFEDVQQAREAMESARTDLAYYLFKADHLTQAVAQRPDLPPAWGRVLLGLIRRIRGRVEGRMTPMELPRDDEAGWRHPSSQDAAAAADDPLPDADKAPRLSKIMPKKRMAELLGISVDQLVRVHGEKITGRARSFRIDLDQLDGAEREAIENAPPPPKGKPRGRTAKNMASK